MTAEQEVATSAPTDEEYYHGLVIIEARTSKALVRAASRFPDGVSVDDLTALAHRVLHLNQLMQANAWLVNREEVIEEEQG
jgi:hypothetical protein